MDYSKFVDQVMLDLKEGDLDLDLITPETKKAEYSPKSDSEDEEEMSPEGNFHAKYGYDSSDEEIVVDRLPVVYRKEELNRREMANKYKEKGNELVKSGKFEDAIEQYTMAISLVETEPSYWANRAFCHLKLNNYDDTIADCSRCIFLDKTYIKAYMRRATARKALNDLHGACRDLQKIYFLEPRNASSRNDYLALRSKIYPTAKTT